VISPRQWAFFIVLVLSLTLALWKGNKPERFGAAIFLSMVALQYASRLFEPRVYAHVDLASVVVDLYALVSFGALAVYSTRIWPIWAASLQLLSLISHFVREVDAGVEPLVYAMMKSGPTFFALTALLLGTLLRIHRSRMGQPDVPWKDW
jgi:hypothetical protein